VDGHCPDGADVCFISGLAQDPNYMAGAQRGEAIGTASFATLALGGWLHRQRQQYRRFGPRSHTSVAFRPEHVLVAVSLFRRFEQAAVNALLEDL
jgi:hypothetical protein